MNLYGVDMVNTTEYIVGGEDGVLLRTTDGGGSCETPVDPPAPPNPPAPVPSLSWWGGSLTAMAMMLLAIRLRRA